MMDPNLAQVVIDIGRVTTHLGTRALLVGAYARDLCLGEMDHARGTNDADFAVLLESWDQVDAFLAGCAADFYAIDRADLKMYHRGTGLKVDIIPCGDIEEPPGQLALRGSQRRLEVVGLARCFDLGQPLHPTTGAVLLPRLPDTWCSSCSRSRIAASTETFETLGTCSTGSP